MVIHITVNFTEANMIKRTRYGFTAKNKRLGIFNERTMEQMISYEKVRTDRCHVSFCMIIFHLNHLGGKKRVISQFIKSLKQNIREFDIMGWITTNRIAILLPSITTENRNNVVTKFTRLSLFSDVVEKTTQLCYVSNEKQQTPVQAAETSDENSQNVLSY